MVEKPSDSEETEADIASDAEYDSVNNLHLKIPRLQSDWKWKKLDNSYDTKYHFLVTMGL
jgi:hypothetical protein